MAAETLSFPLFFECLHKHLQCALEVCVDECDHERLAAITLVPLSDGHTSLPENLPIGQRINSRNVDKLTLPLKEAIEDAFRLHEAEIKAIRESCSASNFSPESEDENVQTEKRIFETVTLPQILDRQLLLWNKTCRGKPLLCYDAEAGVASQPPKLTMHRVTPTGVELRWHMPDAEFTEVPLTAFEILVESFSFGPSVASKNTNRNPQQDRGLSQSRASGVNSEEVDAENRAVTVSERSKEPPPTRSSALRQSVCTQKKKEMGRRHSKNPLSDHWAPPSFKPTHRPPTRLAFGTSVSGASRAIAKPTGGNRRNVGVEEGTEGRRRRRSSAAQGQSECLGVVRVDPKLRLCVVGDLEPQRFHKFFIRALREGESGQSSPSQKNRWATEWSLPVSVTTPASRGGERDSQTARPFTAPQMQNSSETAGGGGSKRFNESAFLRTLPEPSISITPGTDMHLHCTSLIAPYNMSLQADLAEAEREQKRLAAQIHQGMCAHSNVLSVGERRMVAMMTSPLNPLDHEGPVTSSPTKGAYGSLWGNKTDWWHIGKSRDVEIVLSGQEAAAMRSGQAALFTEIKRPICDAARPGKFGTHVRPRSAADRRRGVPPHNSSNTGGGSFRFWESSVPPRLRQKTSLSPNARGKGGSDGRGWLGGGTGGLAEASETLKKLQEMMRASMED